MSILPFRNISAIILPRCVKAKSCRSVYKSSILTQPSRFPDRMRAMWRRQLGFNIWRRLLVFCFVGGRLNDFCD